MKRLAILVALAVNGVAAATVFARLSLEQQVEKAEVIVHATIKGVNVVERDGRPWTVYSLTPKTFVRGAAADLPAADGAPSFAVLGGNGTRVASAPQFKANDEAVLFLYKRAYDSPVVGVRQGAYLVSPGGRVTDLDGNAVQVPVDGKPAPATLDTFLARVRALAGSK